MPIRKNVILPNRHAALRRFKRSRRHLHFAVELLVELIGGLRANELVLRLMIGEVAADQAALRHINMLCGYIKKNDVLRLGRLFAENHASEPHFGPIRFLMLLQELSARHHRPLLVNRELQKVISNFHWAAGLNHALGNRFRASPRHGNRSVGHSGCFGLSRLLFGYLRGAEKRRLAVVDLPVVPQHENCGSQNHPQNGTLKIASHFRSVS